MIFDFRFVIPPGKLAKQPFDSLTLSATLPSTPLTSLSINALGPGRTNVLIAGYARKQRMKSRKIQCKSRNWSGRGVKIRLLSDVSRETAPILDSRCSILDSSAFASSFAKAMEDRQATARQAMLEVLK